MRDSTKKRLVILPDSGQELLRDEIALALGQLGFTALRAHPEQLTDERHEHYLPRLIEQKPDLFLSVNAQGLLPGAPWSRMLLEAGVPVLIWFVDNPWNLLSAMRDPSWKECALAVTDKSFAAPLKAAGAATVLHMPLAASPEHMLRHGKTPESMGGIVFAGRSAFPNLESFFAGQEADAALLAESARRLPGGFGPEGGSYGPRPDFDWWVTELGLKERQVGFWPGKKARKPGKGAVECNKSWRALCLAAAQGGPGGLTVFGDGGWRGIRDLRAPVDYYSALPAIYGGAEFSLNLNSLMLPAGLSQRIFDVWPAQGFCLTDWCAGLEIFPPELVGPITFNAPEELPALAANLRAAPDKKEKLRRNWQQHILNEHSYEKRLSAAFGQLGLL